MVALVVPSHVVVWRWEQAMTYAAELRLHFLSPGDRRQFITRIARLIDIWRLRDKVSATRRGLYRDDCMHDVLGWCIIVARGSASCLAARRSVWASRCSGCCHQPGSCYLTRWV